MQNKDRNFFRARQAIHDLIVSYGHGKALAEKISWTSANALYNMELINKSGTVQRSFEGKPRGPAFERSMEKTSVSQ